ncbi:MAG: endonuclease/exonuclease/phosphatase family protein [Streptosporangiaceae bacterium]|jgi:endonuclease/exonuclease/phosphatase (EEP) superfamily protein YafD
MKVSWAFAGGAAGYGAARLAAADRFGVLEARAVPLLSFAPHAAAGALAGALLVRPRGAAATAAVTGAALAATVLPRTIRRTQPHAGGQVVRVLTANLLDGRASAEAVVGLVRRTDADVLFLQELTGEAAARLRLAGLTDLLPHQLTDRGGRRAGSGICARFPLTSGLRLTPVSVAQPTARLELPAGRHAELVCVHPHAPNGRPWRWRVARWREELAVLPPPGDPPRVLAGDFNATADHAQFRRLLRLGHIDAAAQLGGGLIPTWGPGGRPALLTLDHVLVDPRCAVLAASVHHLPGSDHRAVYAEFRLPT